MKKLLFLFAVSFLIASSVNAQTDKEVVKSEIKNDKKKESAIKKEKREERKELRKLEGKEVSYQAKEAFRGDFGNIPVSKWERLTNFDKATFVKDGKFMEAFYDADADLVGTVTPRSFTDLPAKAQKYINEKYNGYTIGNASFFDDNEKNQTDMILYSEQFDDADNFFIELKRDDQKIVLRVDPGGDVSFFKKLK